MKTIKLSKTQSAGLKLYFERLAQVQQMHEQVKKATESYLMDVVEESGNDPTHGWHYDEKSNSIKENLAGESDASISPEQDRPRLVKPTSEGVE